MVGVFDSKDSKIVKRNGKKIYVNLFNGLTKKEYML